MPLQDQVFLGCTQRESITNESNVEAKSGLFAKMTVADRIFSLKTKTETASLRDPSQDKSTTYNMCAERIVNPQASTLMTVTKEIESPNRKKTDEIVQDVDVAGNLADSKSTSAGMLHIFGDHTFVPTCMGMQEADGSVKQQQKKLR